MNTNKTSRSLCYRAMLLLSAMMLITSRVKDSGGDPIATPFEVARVTGNGLNGPVQAAFDGQRILVTNNGFPDPFLFGKRRTLRLWDRSFSTFPHYGAPAAMG